MISGQKISASVSPRSPLEKILVNRYGISVYSTTAKITLLRDLHMDFTAV